MTERVVDDTENGKLSTSLSGWGLGETRSHVFGGGEVSNTVWSYVAL